MEIERKFTVKELPADLGSFQFHLIEQAYLNTDPVLRIRREDDTFYLTYKGKGMMAREEYNLPLNEASYRHLLEKADGNIISKKRYLIPLTDPRFSSDYLYADGPHEDSLHENAAPALTIELDVFNAPFAPLIIAEVEFPDVDMANAFLMPDWFLEDVTLDSRYHNSNLSKQVF